MDNDTTNLYQTPEAQLDTAVESPGNYSGPKYVPFAQSLKWTSKGFELFKRSPGGWVLTMVAGVLISLLANIIPIANIIYSFAVYVFVGGIFIGAQKVFEGEKLEVSYLFAGFSRYPGRLFLLGIIPFVFVMFIGVIAAIALPALQSFFDQGSVLENAVNASLLGMIAIGSIVPIVLALWFAPVLIVLHGLPLTTAMKESFQGCAKNILSLIVLMVVSVILIMMGSLLALLGLLVAMPIIFGANFAVYQDIYLSDIE